LKEELIGLDQEGLGIGLGLGSDRRSEPDRRSELDRRSEPINFGAC